MDDAAIAFELPHVRAAAIPGTQPADRISVRDYTKAVDIGAFASERGTVQRVRFNVVLEVCHAPAGRDDDVDKVLSYDTITDAIEDALAVARVNLLETLAERIAERCLADRRALRVFVRVEKLDRGPGALGVEIARSRRDDAPRPDPAPAADAAQGAAPLVVLLGRSVLDGARRQAWIDAVAALERPAVLVLEPGAPLAPPSGEAERRIGLLALEQAAWCLVAADARFAVAASRAELVWSLRARRPTVWAPVKLVLDAAEPPPADASRPLALACWLAAEIGAAGLLAAGSDEHLPEGGMAACRLDPDLPEHLARVAAARRLGPGR